MKRIHIRFLAFLAILAAAPAGAQVGGLDLPPSGDNQFASIAQGIGPVRLTTTYHSPDVHAPWGEDRRGKIWGGLVPYGLSSLGPLGACGDQCPWRGGANENTVFTTSHDVKVQGQLLPAGSYGLHFIAGKDEWTVIFSKSSSAWGSYFYDPKEDALRVTARPEKAEYNEWLTYEFTDRKPDRATLALKWEDLQVPFTITVDDVVGLYVQGIRRQLTSSAVFSWENWNAAARYCLQNKTNLAEALGWAERAASIRPLFTTLSTLAGLQAANGRPEESEKTMARAIEDPSANGFELDGYASRLLAQKKNEEAMKVFEINAKRHPGQWVTHFGLARGHAALGRKEQALAEARLSLEKATDDVLRQESESLIQEIEKGEG